MLDRYLNYDHRAVFMYGIDLTVISGNQACESPAAYDYYLSALVA